MAKDERLNSDDIVKTDKPAPKKAKKKRRNPVKAFAEWWRGMRSELKKVMWPTPKQMVNNTLVALAVMCAAAIVVWGFDTAAQATIRAVIAITG